MKRIFPAVKLRPQTPPIDKREIGDTAIPEEFRLSPLSLGSLSNERAVSSDVTLWRCTFWSGKFASLSSRYIVKACSFYLVLWLCGYNQLLCMSLACVLLATCFPRGSEKAEKEQHWSVVLCVGLQVKCSSNDTNMESSDVSTLAVAIKAWNKWREFFSTFISWG